MAEGKIVFRMDRGELGDIIAEAPEDMTIKQLLDQCKRIYNTYNGVGPAIYQDNYGAEPDVIFTYSNVELTPKAKKYDDIGIRNII